jgi:hypothetical protein
LQRSRSGGPAPTARAAGAADDGAHRSRPECNDRDTDTCPAPVVLEADAVHPASTSTTRRIPRRFVDQVQEPASMFRRTLANAFQSDDGETSMRRVEYFLAFVALAAAGILAFLR